MGDSLGDSADRFWSRVDRSGDGCWEWPTKGRYGYFSVGRVVILAHRAAWLLTYGELPASLYVLHHCDNGRCVRPEHLFLGTQRANMRDMYAKGRWSRKAA